MKKFFTYVLIGLVILSGKTYADDLWDNYGDTNTYGEQKAVSDDEFEQALKSKKKKPKRNKNIPKGNELYQSNETIMIKTAEEELPVICIPTNIALTDNTILPIGHYQVEGKKIDGKPYLKLYQAHYLIAQIPANETSNDFNQESVHFVKLLDNGNNQVKIIFGSLDFNAYSILNIAE